MKYVSSKKVFEELKSKLSVDKDVIISTNKDINTTIFFQEQMCNIVDFNRDFLPILINRKELPPPEVLTGLAREVDLSQQDLYQIIFNGLMLMYDHNREKFYLLDISKALRRDTGDSNAEPQNIIG